DAGSENLRHTLGKLIKVNATGFELVNLLVELLDHPVGNGGPSGAVHHRVPEVRLVLVSGNPGRLRTRSQENVVKLSNTPIDIVHPALDRLLVPSPVSERVSEGHLFNSSRSLKPLVQVFGHV